jgi:hypothetical protein
MYPPRDSQLCLPALSVHACQRAWSVPVISQPILAGPQLYAAGPVPVRSCPPYEYQPLQEAPPSVVVFDQRALSLPRTKTLILPDDPDVAAGDDVRIPLRDFHDHVVPSQ